MEPEEFRRLGHEMIDWLADYRARIETLPVMAQTTPGAIRAAFPAAPPQEGAPLDTIFPLIDERIVPGLSLWQSPRFFGYFPANAPLESVLGDFLSTGLGVLGLSWQSSPALTEVEEVMTDWLRQMVGLSAEWSGVIQDTASTSTLVALICARERATHDVFARGGLQSVERPLVIYASSQSHSSVEKAAILAGFGREHLRFIAIDERYAMRPEALAAAIAEDLAQGRQPCAIVATVGTTTTTALDPIAAISAIAQEHNIWLHVDCALAGAAMILPECRWMWEGIEGADSLVINAHKWLGAAFDCSLYYVRDPDQLIRVMSTNPSYLRTAVDEQVKNLRDWGIPLGRRFRALKLWFLLHANGVSGLQARLRRDMTNASWLGEQVRQTAGWQVLAPITLQTLCIRHEPPGLSRAELDAHTLAWCDQVNKSGAAYLGPAMLDGQWMVRVSIGSIATERAHVAELWAAMRAAADAAS